MCRRPYAARSDESLRRLIALAAHAVDMSAREVSCCAGSTNHRPSPPRDTTRLAVNWWPGWMRQ